MGLAQVVLETLADFINVLLAFSYLAPRAATPTERVVMFGNGGGASPIDAPVGTMQQDDGHIAERILDAV